VGTRAIYIYTNMHPRRIHTSAIQPATYTAFGTNASGDHSPDSSPGAGTQQSQPPKPGATASKTNGFFVHSHKASCANAPATSSADPADIPHQNLVEVERKIKLRPTRKARRRKNPTNTDEKLEKAKLLSQQTTQLVTPSTPATVSLNAVKGQSALQNMLFERAGIDNLIFTPY